MILGNCDSRWDISEYGSRRTREAMIGATNGRGRHVVDVSASDCRDDLENRARGVGVDQFSGIEVPVVSPPTDSLSLTEEKPALENLVKKLRRR